MKANYLASPPLVVAYALAGRMDIDLANEPLGQGSDGEDVFLRDLWPSSRRDRRRRSRTSVRGRDVRRAPTPTSSPATSAGAPRHARGRALRVGRRVDVRAAAAVLRRDAARARAGRRTSSGARCLVLLGDSVTTDHISPAGAIRPDSPAGQYLIEHGVERQRLQLVRLPPRQPRGDGARHVRERPAANLLVPGTEGTWTVHLPAGEEMTIFEAAERYLAEGTPPIVHRRQGVRLRLVARLGGEGPEPARRARRDRGVVRADPPLEPADDGDRCRSSSCRARARESLGLTGREEFSIIGARERRGATR